MPTVTAPTRIKLQNIMFATDFTPSAQLALSYALNLAHGYDAGVYTVNVLPHPVFRREGNDLLLQVPVAVHEAALGAKIVPFAGSNGSPGNTIGSPMARRKRSRSEAFSSGTGDCFSSRTRAGLVAA